jgi:hypothetical protein
MNNGLTGQACRSNCLVQDPQFNELGPVANYVNNVHVWFLDQAALPAFRNPDIW